jgi:hypothetical protein
MNLQEPLKIDLVDLSKIVYPKERTNQNKKIILIKLNENKCKNFVFQTPTLLNISKSTEKQGYTEIELALVGKEKGKVDKFISFLNNLEAKIKEDAQFNAYTWFNTSSNENTTINFQKIIRESDDYKSGTIKLKLIKNNDFETIIELNNNKRISIKDIPEDSWCKMILEVYAVWVNSANDFGIFLRPILVSFTPKIKDSYNYKFAEESDEDDEIDIPDTENKANIFMQVNNVKERNNDSTTQLELNELIHHLEINKSQQSSEQSESESIPLISNNDNIISIDLSDANLSNSTSSSDTEDDQ